MNLIFLLPLVVGGIWCIKASVGNIGRQIPLFIAMALFCTSSIQAAEGTSTYCMSAGAENDYDCTKTGASNSNSQENVDTKLSELLRWLEDEEQINNGKRLSSRPTRNNTDRKLQQRIEFNSKLLAGVLLKARTLQDKGDHPQAFDLINSYLTDNPKDLNGWLTYGIALMDQNKLQAAEDIFNKLIELYPDAPEPYNNLAAIYARRGDNNKAIDLLLQGFNTHPSYAQLRLNLKTVYASLANQVYNRALDSNEKNTLVRSNLTILDQTYIATPVAPVYLQAETTLSAGHPVMTAAKAASQQPFASSPTVPLEVVAAVDQATKQAYEAEIETESASPDAAVSRPELSPLDPATAKQMTNLIFRWADAWSGQDVNQYINFYIDQYRSGKAVTHKQWVLSLKKRLSAPAFIQVGISDISMIMLPNERVRAVFQQDYKSNTFQGSAYKSLVFTPVADSWKISAESSL
ncbi:MAG: tetratricopeptide repeat protein [Amphritea sp.]